MKKILLFFKEVLIAALCFGDTVCIAWSGLCIRDEYNTILKLYEKMSLHMLWERLKTAEAFWPFIVAALIISLILLLFILFSQRRRLALMRVAVWLSLSAMLACCLLLVFFLLMSLPAVFDKIVPLSTVLGDIAMIVSFSGFLLFGILACVLIRDFGICSVSKNSVNTTTEPISYSIEKDDD